MKSRHLVLGGWTVVALFTPALTACSGSGSAPATTIVPSLVGVLSTSADLSLAAELLTLTQSDAVLYGKAPYTVFVPTNDAVESYARSAGFADAAALVAAVRSDPRNAGAFVDGFVTEGIVTAKDFPENAGETFTTMGGVDVSIGIDNGVVSLSTPRGTASMQVVDLKSGSTVAHVVDAVLS